MLFMMAVMAVGAADEGTRDLHHAADVNRKKGAHCQCCRRGHRACGRSSPMRWLAVERGDHLSKRNLSQQVAEEDEEEQRPQERHEAVGVFLERRTEDLNAEEFH